MNKKKTKKWLELLFSNADIHVYHAKVSILIKKIVIHIDSQRLAHKAEVNQLHQEIEKLTDKLIREKILHNGTKKLLEHTRIALDDKNGSITFFEQQLSICDQSLFDECSYVQQLEIQKATLYKVLGLIHNKISRRKKRMYVKEYNAMLAEINASIEEALPNQRRR